MRQLSRDLLKARYLWADKSEGGLWRLFHKSLRPLLPKPSVNSGTFLHKLLESGSVARMARNLIA